MTPNPNVSKPAVLRSEPRLVATDKKYASQETASYFFDKALVSCFQPGDVFHMVQTYCGGLGASAIRQGKLIFAVGQVTAVPLGSGISASIPSDLFEEAQEFVSEPVKAFARSLRATPGKHIWMMGGGELIASFLDANEIDEFDIHVIPTFIGEGIPLVAPRHRDIALRLRSARKFPDGVVRLHYEIAR